MKVDNLNRIVHCHVVRITEPGQGDQPVIVEWKVPDPEPMVPNPFGSHIVVTISPNIEAAVWEGDPHTFEREVFPAYVSSVDIGWTQSESVYASENGYIFGAREYGVEFWMRVQHQDGQGPGKPFDPNLWAVYRFHRCIFTSVVNFQEWAAVAHLDNKQIYTMSVVTSTDDKKEES